MLFFYQHYPGQDALLIGWLKFFFEIVIDYWSFDAFFKKKEKPETEEILVYFAFRDLML